MNRRCDYHRLSLLDLATRIVNDADRDAMREVCERRLFHAGDHECLRLTELLDLFCQGLLDPGLGTVDAHIRENAYNLTLDKFTHLPEQDAGRARPAGSRPTEGRRSGPDCRLYYGAFLKYATEQLEGVKSQLDRELGAARRLQVFVNRHFALSCRECIRQGQRLTKRHAWRVNGHAVTLRMPSWMSAAECRIWLETHIGQTDPSQPGKQARIQTIVDDLLGRPVVRRFSEMGIRPETLVTERISSRESVLEDLANLGLAEAVAKEKAESILAQRPAIRRLGKTTLAEMIRRIFSDLAAGSYSDNAVARKFGVSKATFSRFAGSRWRRPNGDHSEAGMPDLWRNLAQVLGSHPDFVEAARSADWSSSGQLFDAGAPGDAAEAERGRELSHVRTGFETDGDMGAADEKRGPTPNGLCFIPMIARALHDSEVHRALRDVFARMEQLGRCQSYEPGAGQFQRFMNAAMAVADRASSEESGSLEEWMRVLASGDPENGRFETLMNKILDLPRGSEPPELIVFRDDREIGTITVTIDGSAGRLSNISAGGYRVASRTGWTLWEGQLSAEQVRWSSAFPGRPYEVAADTERRKRVATLTETLLDGELVLYVFPRVECGQLTVELGDVH